MPDTSVKLQDITPVKSTFDSDDQLLLINATGEARISKEDFMSAMPDVAITLIGDITTTGIEGDTVAKQLGALKNSKAAAITETATGVVANFPDGADDIPVTSLVADIEPVQDLNGYDNPWPAGGGVNKLDPAEVTVYSSPVYGFTVTWNANDGSLNINGTYTGSGSSAVFRALKVPSAVRSLNVKGFSSSSNFSLMRWKDGADQVVAELTGLAQNSSYNITVYPIVYEGSTAPASWTPYSNICPISGHAEVNVTRCGKNLFNESQYQNLVATYEYNLNSYHCKAIQLAPNTTYTVSQRAGTADSNVIALLNNNQAVNSSGYFDLRKASDSKTYTTDNTGCLYLGVIYYNSDTDYNARLDLCQIQVELGSTATTYEEYVTPSTVSVSWTTEAGTVYGGTLDVTTGVLTVDRACVTLEGKTSISTFNVTTDGIVPCYLNPTNFTGSGSADYGFPSPKLNQRVVLCNWLKYGTDIKTALASNMVTWSDTFYRYEFAVPISDAVVGDAGSTHKTAVIDYLNQNPLQLCYELATPQTYQLTPQEVKTLLGTNNIFSDCSSVEVEYRADTKLYIEKLTMPTEDDMTANQAITSGKFFMVGNNLYLATAAIASGAKIIEGTNATRLSLADALNRL